MATRIGLRWKISPDHLAREVRVRRAGMQREADSGFGSLAEEAEGWMKANAPWNDRTGDARNNLTAKFNKQGNTYNIRFQHGVRYGIFLEYGTRYMGKYPIILPAIQRHSEKARAVMRRAVQEVTN